ncbi:hypothetical protein PF005_g16170 [Phytophthora fragariae]|uniref:Secreted protein n=1 Tax=Phytophthora fragariae TaxID=53985 RepID=A0A6A3JYD5_9STRA|nr:hypothetical protein PF003_g839 [Phytophthora fragariae]KAE8932132.1 hypothetical protein PF009_g17829 [Phytophthora fragariae]KAE8997405.1 hypothetical protein PF011_g15504 [Phytophthora fragariae]KAE9096770.1 hypothetical protein PF007_g16866 [Phytophthora fragariae]KAE9109724.1 hypothetical protein PF010_g11432 [Phytophthora fragariae]
MLFRAHSPCHALLWLITILFCPHEEIVGNRCIFYKGRVYFGKTSVFNTRKDPYVTHSM